MNQTMTETTSKTPDTAAIELFKQALAEGKTTEEALQMVVASAVKKVPTARKDNLAYIASLRNIPEVRRVKKIAYAKVSKSKERPEAVARYQEEIKAADEKLNELLSEVNQAKEPWKKAMELGEDAKGAFQYFLTPYKDEIDKAVDKAAAKMTKAEVKAALLAIKPIIPDELPELFKPVATERLNNGDMMLLTIFRKASFLKNPPKVEPKTSTKAPETEKK